MKQMLQETVKFAASNEGKERYFGLGVKFEAIKGSLATRFGAR